MFLILLHFLFNIIIVVLKELRLSLCKLEACNFIKKETENLRRTSEPRPGFCCWILAGIFRKSKKLQWRHWQKLKTFFTANLCGIMVYFLSPRHISYLQNQILQVIILLMKCHVCMVIAIAEDKADTLLPAIYSIKTTHLHPFIKCSYAPIFTNLGNQQYHYLHMCIRTFSNMSDGAFCINSLQLSTTNYSQKLHLRCLTGFWTCL